MISLQLPGKYTLSFAMLLASVASMAIAQAADQRPANNPYLASPVYAVTHVDSAQSDVAPYPLARGTFHIDLSKADRSIRGPVNIVTLASTSPDYVWGMSTEGVTLINVSNGGFKEIARATPPGIKVLPPADIVKLLDARYETVDQIKEAVARDWGLDQTRIGNGIYGVVDRDNRVYYNSFDGSVYIYGMKDPGNPEAGIELVASRNFKDVLTGKKGFTGSEGIIGLNMTYDGKLIVLGNNSVSIIDRDLKDAPQTVRFEPDEFVSNSGAVDDHNGIYVASDKQMHKVVWTGGKLSNDAADGAWASPYDDGEWMPTVKFGTGTGSTPTLMGFGDDPDKLVVITDGADRMKLVAFWRNEIPAYAKPAPDARSPRIAGQHKVTAGLPESTRYIQSEQSVVIKGYGAFVVNNIAKVGDKDKIIDVLSLGPINPPATGAERVDWDPATHAWKSTWVNPDAVSISMAPTMSGVSDIVMINGYSKQDGWEMSGLDWQTGEIVYRAIFGQTNWGNGAYAEPQLFPNGDLLFNSIGGPTRVVNK